MKFILCGLMTGLVGLTVGFGAADLDFQPLKFLIASFLGAALGGVCTAPLFGIPAPKGWILAGLGATGATTIGSIAGAAIYMLPHDFLGAESLALGPVLIAFVFLQLPPVAILWLAGFAAIHFVMRRLTPGNTGCP